MKVLAGCEGAPERHQESSMLAVLFGHSALADARLLHIEYVGKCVRQVLRPPGGVLSGTDEDFGEEGALQLSPSSSSLGPDASVKGAETDDSDI